MKSGYMTPHCSDGWYIKIGKILDKFKFPPYLIHPQSMYTSFFIVYEASWWWWLWVWWESGAARGRGQYSVHRGNREGMLASDWSRVITWPGCWPLIGPGRLMWRGCGEQLSWCLATCLDHSWHHKSCEHIDSWCCFYGVDISNH